MKIPRKFQIFPQRVTVTPRDSKRLAPSLREWHALAAALHRNAPEDDLRRMVVIELLGARRWHILARLVMRLGRVQRRALEATVRRLCR